MSRTDVHTPPRIAFPSDQPERNPKGNLAQAQCSLLHEAPFRSALTALISQGFGAVDHGFSVAGKVTLRLKAIPSPRSVAEGELVGEEGSPYVNTTFWHVVEQAFEWGEDVDSAQQARLGNAFTDSLRRSLVDGAGRDPYPYYFSLRRFGQVEFGIPGRITSLPHEETGFAALSTSTRDTTAQVSNPFFWVLSELPETVSSSTQTAEVDFFIVTGPTSHPNAQQVVDDYRDRRTLWRYSYPWENRAQIVRESKHYPKYNDDWDQDDRIPSRAHTRAQCHDLARAANSGIDPDEMDGAW